MNWKEYVVKHNYVNEDVLMTVLDNYMFQPLMTVLDNYMFQPLMAILDNYMFRPLMAIFRLSSRELKVLLYILCAHMMERSLHPGLLASVEFEVSWCAPRNFKLDSSHQTLSCLSPEHTTASNIEITYYAIKPGCRDLSIMCAHNICRKTLISLEDNLKMASRGRNM